MKFNSVLIVDDHAAMRIGLKELLKGFQPMLKFYESEDGDSMIEILKNHSIDLVMLDLQMENTDTIKLVEMVSIKYPQASVLIFSMLPEKIFAKRLLQAGAKGFLPKSAPINEIRRAFETVLESKRYISNAMAELLADEIVEKRSSDPFAALSQREFEITQELVSGSSINCIAQKFNIRPSTVSTYKSRIFEKVHVSNVFQLRDLATLNCIPTN